MRAGICGYSRTIGIGLAICLYAGLAVSKDCKAEGCETVYLSTDETAILVRIMKRDDTLKKFAATQNGLSALNSVLKVVTPGPLKLTFAWNQGAFEGWRIANKSLSKIGMLATCQDIGEAQTLNKYELCFWENLSRARGCKDL